MSVIVLCCLAFHPFQPHSSFWPCSPQLFEYPLQLDLLPDVQETYVAELIQKNNVKDLNV